MEQQGVSNIRHLALKFTMLVMIIFVAVTVFAGVLNTMSFQKVTTEVYANASRLSTTGAVQKIQYALSFGKPIEKFYGMNEIIQETMKLSEDIIGVGIINKDKKVIYSVGDGIENVPDGLDSQLYIDEPSGIFTGVNIDEEASIVLLLKKDYISSSINDYIKSIILVDLVVFVIVAIISFMCAFLMSLRKNKTTFKQLKIAAVSLLVLAQLGLGIYVTLNFTSEYSGSLNKIASIISNIVDKDMEKLTSNGIPMKEFIGFDKYLDGLAAQVPEVDRISVSNYRDRNAITTQIEGTEEPFFINVNCRVNQALIDKKLIDFAIDAAILILVTILLSLEISLFIGEVSSRASSSEDEEERTKLSFSGMRMWFFIMYLGINLDSSFVAVVSYKLFDAFNTKGLPASVAGLPITLGMVFTIIGIMLTGAVVSIIGIKTLLIAGTIFAAGGMLLAGLATTFPVFILARCILGIGFAALLAGGKLCSTAQPDSKSRTKFLAMLSAGTAAGMSCGVVIGGLISDRTSFSFVFILSAIILLLGLSVITITKLKLSDKVSSVSLFSVFNIIRNPMALGYIIFLVVPIYISSLFVSYSIPLYGSEINLSQTVVSAMIMANCILTAYLSNSASKLSLSALGAQNSTILYALCTCGSILLFVLGNSFIYAVISVLLLGLADSFGLIVVNENFYNFVSTDDEDDEDIGKTVDPTTVMIIFLLASKIGGAISPTLISKDMHQGSAKASSILVQTLGVGLVLYILLLVISRISKKITSKKRRNDFDVFRY